MALSLPDTFGPARANTLGTRRDDPAKKVGTAPVTLVDLVLCAGERAGMTRQELAGVFSLSEADFSKAFSSSDVWAERNRVMKTPLPERLAQSIVTVAAERTGVQHRAALTLVRAVSEFLTVTVAAVNE